MTFYGTPGVKRFNTFYGAQGVKRLCQALHVDTMPYMFKVNNGNTRTRCEICSKLTIITSERRQWHRSGVFIVNFEHTLLRVQVFLLLTLSRQMQAGKKWKTSKNSLLKVLQKCIFLWLILLMFYNFIHKLFFVSLFFLIIKEMQLRETALNLMIIDACRIRG